MEEDNRSYHPSHSQFHQYQLYHHRNADIIAGLYYDCSQTLVEAPATATATTTSTTTTTTTTTINSNDGNNGYHSHINSDGDNEIQANNDSSDNTTAFNNMGMRCSNNNTITGGPVEEGRDSRRNTFEQKLPSLSYLVMSAITTTNPPYTVNTVDNDVGIMVENQHDDQLQQQRATATASSSNPRMNRLLVETHGLFYDYQQRFYRQSLIKKAEELLEQAAAAAAAATTENYRNSNDCNSNTEGNNASVNLALYTDAIKLCIMSIQDYDNQEHDNDRTVGGRSYFVTGDIQILHKAELLVAKVYCLRASLYYNRMENYSKCLDDCNSAITIWNRLCIGGNCNNRRRNCHHNNGDRPMISQQQPPVSPLSPTRRRRRRRRSLLSHKNLYLLKGRALAGLGRYNEASKWLLNQNQTPYQNFQGQSQLINDAGNMYSVLYKITKRGYCGSGVMVVVVLHHQMVVVALHQILQQHQHQRR
jgi:hypothetical protein